MYLLKKWIFIPPKNECFWWGILESACLFIRMSVVSPSAYPSVYKIASFCQSAVGGIMSHSVMALVLVKLISCLNTLPKKPLFLSVCRTSLLKTLWEREK